MTLHAFEKKVNVITKIFVNIFLLHWWTRLKLHTFGKKVNGMTKIYVNIFTRHWLTRLTLHAFWKKSKCIFGPSESCCKSTSKISYRGDFVVPHTLTNPYVNVFIRRLLTRLTLHAFGKKVIFFLEKSENCCESYQPIILVLVIEGTFLCHIPWRNHT